MDTIEPLTAYDVRKKSEEFALQHTAPLTPPLSVTQPDNTTYTHSSSPTVQSVSASRSTPAIQLPSGHEGPLFNKMMALAQAKPSTLEDLDAIFFKIMKLMESQDSTSLKTKEQLFTALKEWQRILEKELLVASEKMSKTQGASNLLGKIGHSLGPLSVVIAGVLSCATGGITAIPVCLAALGALLFLDSVCDDMAKKSLASLLAQGEKEKTETWLQRIQLVSGVISMGLTMGVGIAQSLKIATVVSQTALESIKAGCDFSKNSLQAKLLELRSSFELSKNHSDEIIQKWELIMNGIFERYEQFLSLQAARLETTRQIVRHIHQ